MLLSTFPLPQRRRSPSGKLFYGTPASSSSATALPARNTSASAPWPATSSRWLFATLPLASSSATASRPAAFAGCPYQQFRHGAPASNIFPKALHCSAPASSNSVRAPQPAAFAGCPYQQLRHGTPGQQVFPMALPASNKPHSAEKSTPVWLAIWCTCAGFANSQLRCATSCSTY